MTPTSSPLPEVGHRPDESQCIAALEAACSAARTHLAQASQEKIELSDTNEILQASLAAAKADAVRARDSFSGVMLTRH